MPRDYERSRLRERYREMSDTQLEDIAAGAFSLTDAARAVLGDEIARRRLGIELQHAPPETPNPPNLVVVATFRDLPEAELARGILDSAGITCFLDDANTIRMDWFLSNAIGGIKLPVGQEDATTANELLNQPPPESFDTGESDEFVQPRCPSCGSLDVTFQELIKPMAYSSLFIGLPVPIRRIGWRYRAGQPSMGGAYTRFRAQAL